MIARIKGLKNGGGRGHARGEQPGLMTTFQRIENGFGLLEGGIVVACIRAAIAMLIVLVADICRRGMNLPDDFFGALVDPAQRLCGNAFGFLRFHFFGSTLFGSTALPAVSLRAAGGK